MSLESFRARFRHLALHGQALAVVLSLVQALLWVPMWAVMLHISDELHLLAFGRELHWINWAMLWATAVVRVALWAIKDLLDLDMSDNRGTP